MAFGVAGATAFAFTPVAIAVAHRTGFLDRPQGYKGHRRPTPYLGGTAVVLAIAVATTVLGDLTGRLGTLLACAAVLWMVGTVDDRWPMPPAWRVLAEVGVAVVIWSGGWGWSVLGSDPADLLLTIVWVVGLVNAFNLMDNIDGATSTVAAISTAGIGTLAALRGHTGLAVFAFAVSGACVGFLPRNLAGPAKIFLGDGGSMTLGFLVASLTLLTVDRYVAGSSGLFVAALFAGLPILDTTLVVLSRRRRGIPILTGRRDHLTHRLLARVGTPRRVAALLAGVQTLLGVSAIVGYYAGHGVIIALAGLALLQGVFAIVMLESSDWAAPGATPVVDAETPSIPGESVRLEAFIAARSGRRLAGDRVRARASEEFRTVLSRRSGG